VHYKPNAFKVTLMFPMRDNEGRPFPTSVWRWWRVEMTRLLSGFTDAGEVEGYWQRQTEQNKMLLIVLKSENKLNEIRSFLQQARIRFRQKAMYFEFHPVFQEDIR
jgi:hypothetical protein